VNAGQHLYNAEFPDIPLKLWDVWYRHPFFPVSCNEFGALRSEDPRFTVEQDHYQEKGAVLLYREDQRKSITYVNFLHDCYTGTLPGYKRIMWYDGNFYNNTKDNLVSLVYEKDLERALTALDNTMIFCQNTLDYIQSRIDFYCRKGAEAKTVLSCLRLPYFFDELYKNPEKIKTFENQKRYIVKRIEKIKKQQNVFHHKKRGRPYKNPPGILSDSERGRSYYPIITLDTFWRGENADSGSS